MISIDRPGIAWITGASKGIGRELALTLAARGWTVAISARNAADLKAVADDPRALGRVSAYVADTTDGLGVAAVVNRISSDHGPIDLAILNAGTHIPVAADQIDPAAFATLVQTNLMGTVNCLAALTPGMIARRSGEIAVVASMTGYFGMPTSAAYGATKAGLINMCESLKPELDYHGVSMRLVNPGFVDTPLTQRNPFPMPFLVPAPKAAELIIRGLGRRRFEITVPWQMAIGMKLLRLLPYPLLFAAMRRIVPKDSKDRAATRAEPS